MIRSRWMVAVLGTALVATSTAPRQARAQTTVVRAGHMFDPVSGTITGPVSVVVQAGRIRDVNRSRAPAGATVVNLGDLTLLPGLIDMHTHLTGDLEGDWVTRDVRETAADAALRGARNAKRTLRPDQALKAVRYQIKHGAKVIKICATAGVLSFEGPVGVQQLSEAEMRVIVEEAARPGLKVAAHAHGTEGIKAAIRAGVASIEHGSMLDDEAIQLMREHGTYLVPTTYLADAIDLNALPPPIRAKAEVVLPLAKESVRRAIAGGVKIAFGTDAAVYPHGLNAREFKSLVDRGMRPADALRAATVNAADLLGVSDRGRIAPGLLADMVAVRGNPLQDITVMQDVQFVMKDGRVYKQPSR